MTWSPACLSSAVIHAAISIQLDDWLKNPSKCDVVRLLQAKVQQPEKPKAVARRGRELGKPSGRLVNIFPSVFEDVYWQQ